MVPLTTSASRPARRRPTSPSNLRRQRKRRVYYKAAVAKGARAEGGEDGTLGDKEKIRPQKATLSLSFLSSFAFVYTDFPQMSSRPVTFFSFVFFFFYHFCECFSFCSEGYKNYENGLMYLAPPYRLFSPFLHSGILLAVRKANTERTGY